MKTKDLNELIFEDDFVIDHMDDNAVRQVAGFSGDSTVHMTDGGIMDTSEISFDDVR